MGLPRTCNLPSILGNVSLYVAITSSRPITIRHL